MHLCTNCFNLTILEFIKFCCSKLKWFWLWNLIVRFKIRACFVWFFHATNKPSYLLTFGQGYVFNVCAPGCQEVQRGFCLTYVKISFTWIPLSEQNIDTDHSYLNQASSFLCLFVIKNNELGQYTAYEVFRAWCSTFFSWM